MPAADRMSVGGRSVFRDVAACGDPTGAEPRPLTYVMRDPEGNEFCLH
jgi:hypothetical protein